MYIILTLSIIVYIFFHPTNEQLLCNDQFECVVKHQYFYTITFKNKFKITKDSYLTGDLFMRHASRPLYHERVYTYTVNPKILNSNYKLIKPFIYYYEGYSRGDGEEESSIEELLDVEINSFKEYINNPQREFYLETQRGDIILLVIIGFAAFSFSMYYIFNFIEKKIEDLFLFIKNKISRLNK